MSTSATCEILSGQGGSIAGLKKQLEGFEKALAVFLYIKEGDKIGKCQDKYALYRAGYTQNWARRWYGETRDKTLQYLDIDFTRYVKYLDNLLEVDEVQSLIEYKQVISDTVDFTNRIIPGLYALKTTYENYKKLRCKIDSIILIFIDFKDKIASRGLPRVVQRSRCWF